MKTNKLFQIIFLLLLISFSGCRKKEECTNSTPGTLRNLTGLDGCSWVIELENGKRLEPINLADFNIALKDGKKVKLAYEPSPMLGSICMVGEIVKIRCIVETSGGNTTR